MEEYPRKNLINTPKKMHTSYPSKSPRYAQDMFIYVQPNAFKFSAKAMYGMESNIKNDPAESRKKVKHIN